jgi:hypothetical protein
MTEAHRQYVLEHPGQFTADELSDAWAMTAEQCREKGPAFAWAAQIAEREAKVYATVAVRSRARERR